MAYHEGFWITVTTATPVLALAYVLSTSEANRFDHEVTDLGIWGDTKAKTILLLSLLGFVASAADFMWGILSLIWREDRGPLALPAALIMLSFLMFLLLKVLEMRAYSWLKARRYEFDLAERLAVFPETLKSTGATDFNGHIYWPLSEADKVLSAIEKAGFLVTGANVRHDAADGSWTVSPLGRYGSVAHDTRATVINDLRTITSRDVWVEITWGPR